jgi:DNA mismatch repair ATPase MutS
MEKLKSLILDKDLSDKLVTLDEFNNDGITKESIFKIIPEFKETNKDLVSECKLGKNLFYDLEFFKDYVSSSDENSSVISSIDHTYLKGSPHYLEHILSNPVCCPKILKQRQNVIKNIKDKIFNEKTKFSRLKELEDDMLWIYEIKDSDKGYDMLYDMVYFNNWMISKLNHNEKVLNAYNLYRIIGSPSIGIISPISYFVVPYMILIYKMKIKLPFTDYLKTILRTLFSSSGMGYMGKFKYISLVFSIVFYFQGLFNSVEISKATYKISQTITNKINNVVEYIKISKELNDKLWDKEISCFSDDDTIIQLNNVNCFDKYNLNKFGIFSGFGRQLKIYKFIKSELYIPLFRRIYILDVVHNLCLLQSEYSFTFPEYKCNSDTRHPSLNIGSVWHPCINSKNRVSNDVVINKQRNLIITGPNAGGKSTTIKTILIAVIFSQSIGLCPANKIELTPFYYISSQINIPDCKGKESLFEAEMYRSKENIEIMSSIESDKYSILVMDEIFNSTNPIEGISGAYAICKKLSSCTNNVCIISTHYLYLTKLAKDFPERFINYKMNVVMDDKKMVKKFPYKLKQGISRQYIAIELLKENGFDNDIINDALFIKDKFLK